MSTSIGTSSGLDSSSSFEKSLSFSKLALSRDSEVEYSKSSLSKNRLAP